MPTDIATVMGTYNRLSLLQACVESLRRARGSLSQVILVADGGSQDGTREWLVKQPDCELLEGGLNGVVAAYNVAFSRAVAIETPHVCVFNDDANFVGPEPELQRAVELLRERPEVGFVNFATDRYGKWAHLRIFDTVCYGNYGVTRRDVGMAVARFHGDPTGRTWWNTNFHSYATDTVFGLTLMRLGWRVYEADDWRVHDSYASSAGDRDPLRARNFAAHTPEQLTYFQKNFGSREFMNYNRQDAETYGGRVA